MKELTGIPRAIWEDRYQHNGETPEGTLRRVADALATTEKDREDFFRIMDEGKFYPAGRTMCNAGLGKNLTYNNCYCLNSVPDSMQGIFETVKTGALTQQAGGGTGYDFSSLRPKKAKTSNSGVASGPVSFIQVFNAATETIMQANRRGANMGCISCWHPDVVRFVKCKSDQNDPNAMQRFNLSVMVDDKFLEAAQNDETIMLHWPVYDDQLRIEEDPSKWKITRKVKAKKLWNMITWHAYICGDPGILFYDTMNRYNNMWYCEQIVTTNPCAEFISGQIHNESLARKSVVQNKDVSTYKGACNLGSLFLPAFLKERARPSNGVHIPDQIEFAFDWDALDKAIPVAVTMLDSIIDKTYFPHADYEGYQKNMRTIGLGFTGLADVIALLGMRYGSDEAALFAEYLTNFIAVRAYKQSTVLADYRGTFPFYDGEKFLESNYLKERVDAHPMTRKFAAYSLARCSNESGCDELYPDWYTSDMIDEEMTAFEKAITGERDLNSLRACFMALDAAWVETIEAIRDRGMRNARLMSVAPTGTISLVFGNNCSSGLEPIYQLSSKRDIKMGGQDEENINTLVLEDPAWVLYQKLQKGLKDPEKDCLSPVYDVDPKRCFVAVDDTRASDHQITVDEHLKMLAAVANYVDMSCSKTINIPTEYSFEDTKEVYLKAWKAGIKGCTIFRPNEFRQGIFSKVDDEEEAETPAEILTDASETASMAPQSELKRGEVLQVTDDVVGLERHLKTGCGTLHFQAFFDPHTGHLVETYASKGSTGGCNSFMVGLSRQISLSARAGVPVDKIVDQLLSSPPCTSYTSAIKTGEDTSRGLCCPAAMGHALKSMHEQITTVYGAVQGDQKKEPAPVCEKKKAPAPINSAYICPDCGQELIVEGGCNVCKSCGYSKCG